MKQWAINTLVVAALTAALVYLFYDPVSDRAVGDGVVVRGQPAADTPGDDLVGGPTVALPPPAPASGAAGTALDAPRPATGLDPMLVMGRGEFSESQIQAYNERHVLPFNPEVGQDCRERPDVQFPGEYYTTCETLRERPPHPYERLPDGELRDLAVHDAVASLLLGERSTVEQERVYWHLRAAALAEKTGPLMRLAERRYGAPYRMASVAGSVAPVPDTDAMVTRLALETVAARLGDPRANPQRRRQELIDATAGQAQPALERVDALVTEFLEHMAEVQRQVTGSIQVREVIDV